MEEEEIKEEEIPSNTFVDGPQIIGRDSDSDSDKAIKVRKSVKVDGDSNQQPEEKEPEFKIMSRISKNYLRQSEMVI